MVLIRLLAFLKQDVPFKKHALWTYPEQLHNGRDRELLVDMKLSDSLRGVYQSDGTKADLTPPVLKRRARVQFLKKPICHDRSAFAVKSIWLLYLLMVLSFLIVFHVRGKKNETRKKRFSKDTEESFN